MFKNILAIGTLLALTGCAFTEATVTSGPDTTLVQAGPLAEIDTVAFEVGAFSDGRDDTMRIGYKVNGFGQNTADIINDRPVDEVVRDAVVVALEANGHSVGEGKFMISGTVQQFWVEIDPGFTSIEVNSTIEADIRFAKKVSGEAVYQSIYRGSFKDNRQFVGEGAFNDAVSGALNSLIDEISFDEDLAEALID